MEKKSYLSFGMRGSSVPFKICFLLLYTLRTKTKNKYVSSGSVVLFYYRYKSPDLLEITVNYQISWFYFIEICGI